MARVVKKKDLIKEQTQFTQRLLSSIPDNNKWYSDMIARHEYHIECLEGVTELADIKQQELGSVAELKYLMQREAQENRYLRTYILTMDELNKGLLK